MLRPAGKFYSSTTCGFKEKTEEEKMVISRVFVHNIGVCLPLKVNMKEGAGQITNERERKRDEERGRERERGVATKSLQLLVFL